MDPSGDAEVVAEFDDHPTGLGFLPDGNLVVALMLSRRLMLVDAKRTVRTYVELSRYAPNRINDIVIDGEGRIYVDNIVTPKEDYLEGKASHNGLMLVTPSREVRIVVDEGLTRPNGLAITGDGQTLIVAETGLPDVATDGQHHGQRSGLGTPAGPPRRLTAYSINRRDGSLSNGHVFADTGGPAPDGICIDGEGAVWLGSPYTFEAVRILAGGHITHRIPLGTDWCTCVALGGADRRTLYMATWTVPVGISPANSDQTLGSIQSTLVDVPGTGWP